MRSSRIIICLVVVSFVSTTIARADNDRDRRKRIVGDILKLLIESQAPKRRPNPGVVPPFPMLPQPRPGVQPLRAVQQELGGLVNVTAQLSQDIGQRARVNPGLRRLLIQCTKLNAEAAAVYRKSAQVRDYRHLYADVQTLDRNARSFLHEMTRIPGTPAKIQQQVETINAHTKTLSALYGIKNQVDLRGLVQAATTLNAHLKTLDDDVQLGYGRDRRYTALIEEGIKVNQLASRFSRMLAHKPSQAKAVASYRVFATAWQNYHHRLAQLGNRFIDRSVARVSAVDATIHKLLRIRQGLDRQRLDSLARAVAADLTRFCDKITLTTLMKLPNAGEIPAAADQLDGVCANFLDCVRRKETDKELAEAFAYIPSAWVAFHQNFRDVRDPQLQAALGHMETHIKDLRTALHLPGGLDRRAAARIAYRIEKNAEKLGRQVGLWMRRPGTNNLPYRNELIRGCASLEKNAHTLEQYLLRGGTQQQFQTTCETMYRGWRNLPANLLKCQSPEATEIRTLQRQITLDLVELEVLFLF